MPLTITLSHPSKELSPNGRLHPHAKAKLTKEHRQFAEATMRKRLNLNEDNSRYNLGGKCLIEWRFKGRRPDVDNIAGLCKAYLDGICDACQYNDRNFNTLKIVCIPITDKAAACVAFHFPYSYFPPTK